MSRLFGSRNRSLSYPSNLQGHSPNISISDFTPYLVASYTNISPRMNSDDTSTQTVFHRSQNLTILILKPQTISKTPSPARPLFLNSPSDHSIPQLLINLPLPLLPTLMQLQFSSQSMTSDPPDPLAPLMENSKMNLIV